MRIWVLCLALVSGCRWGFGSLGNPPADSPPTGDGSGKGSDAGAIDAPRDGAMAIMDAPATPCSGTTHTITDNFNDNTFNAALWGGSYEDSVSTHVETNARLEIHLGTNVSDNWAGYATTSLYQLKDDRVFVEAPVVTTYDGTMLLLLWTTTARTDGPSIEYESGHLIMRRRVNSVINDYANITYNAAQMRWWQIREHNNTTYWETSPDAVTWTTRFSQATPGATTALITLAAGTGNAIATADVVAFDNFNGGGAPPSCP